MKTPINWPVLLTVRGVMLPKTLEAMRVLHNQTAGSPQGIAAARSLGDLSHMVYAPGETGNQETDTSGELLFLDIWTDPQGIMDFFANEQVVQQGSKLFSSREPTIWMQATDSFSYHLPAPRSRTERFLGMVRGPIASPDKAIEIFRAADIKAQRDARNRGLLSHEIFIKMNPPDSKMPLELLGLDVWCSFDGMGQHYADPKHNGALGEAFSGAPASSLWQPAAGEWSEW